MAQEKLITINVKNVSLKEIFKDTFAADPGAITTDAIIAQLKEDENTKRVQPQVDAFIAKYTEIAEGADTASLTPEGIIALVNAYAEATNGADVSGLTPQNVTAMVAAYEELASGVDISTLKPDEITAYISNYLEEHNVDTLSLIHISYYNAGQIYRGIHVPNAVADRFLQDYQAGTRHSFGILQSFSSREDVAESFGVWNAVYGHTTSIKFVLQGNKTAPSTCLLYTSRCV